MMMKRLAPGTVSISGVKPYHRGFLTSSTSTMVEVEFLQGLSSV
jgi:hypothetical protein